MANLQNILQDIGAILNQDTTLPTGTDLSMQVNLVDQALKEWGEAYEWKQLRVPNFGLTVLLSATSLGLPSNYEKLMSRPFDQSLSSGNDYEELRPEDRFTKGVNDRYCYTGGDDSIGHFIVFNPPLASGASIVFDYQATPSSMATLQDVLVCPSKNFIVQRVLGKIYESRQDTRFPQFNSEANNAMIQLIQEESALSGAQSNVMPTFYEKIGFKIGG